MVEGLEDMDDMDDADGGEQKRRSNFSSQHTSGNMGKPTKGHDIQADSSKLQFEAMQYGFFADGGAGESLELDIGGIEDGVEAPPEEELLGGGLGQPDALEWDVPLEDISNATAFALDEHQRAPDDSMTNSVTANFADLSVASELLAQPRSQALPASGLLRPASFASDPKTTGPPRRQSTSNSTDWPLHKNSRTNSFGSNAEALAQPIPSVPSLQDTASQYSNFGPSHSFSQTPSLSGIKDQGFSTRLSSDTVSTKHSFAQQPFSWQQQQLRGNNVDVEQPTRPQPNQKGPLTLEEVEARMFSQPSEPVQPARHMAASPIPMMSHTPQQLIQNPSLGQSRSLTQNSGFTLGMHRTSTPAQTPPAYPAPSGPPSLSRHSLTGDVDPTNSRLFSSLPSGTMRSAVSPGLHPVAGPGLSFNQFQAARRPPPPPPAPLAGMPILQRRSLTTQPNISPGTLVAPLPLPQPMRPMGPQFVMQPRPPQQPLLRPAMLARGPGGRGFGGVQGPLAAPFVNNLLPVRPQPPPEDGSAASLRWHGSKFMLPEEIDSILRIQWKSLHNGAPYQEDYYYQALVHKITQGANSRDFTPDALRDLAPAEKSEEEPLAYVRLEGLGKIPYSDIKRPKPLMDLVASPKDNEADMEKGTEETRSKPLEQEPLLAARIVIEDCMCLLLDVDDIDRVCKNIFRGRDDDQVASLRHRRILLLDALASSLRLPHTNVPSTDQQNSQPEESDMVLKRLAALHKGRKLLARVLRLLPGSLPQIQRPNSAAEKKIPIQRILWSTLRIAHTLFSVLSPHNPSVTAEDRQDKQNMMDITTEIALALIRVISSLDSGQALVDCMTTLTHGDFGSKSSDNAPAVLNLLPLLPSGEPLPIKRTWLADVVTVLLECARRRNLLGSNVSNQDVMSQLDESARQLTVKWNEQLEIFWAYLHRHLKALAAVCVMANESGAHDAANYARHIVPRNLIQAFVPHATQQQQADLAAVLPQIFPE